MRSFGVEGHDAIARLLGKPGDHIQGHAPVRDANAVAIIAPGTMTGARPLLHLHSSHESSTGSPLL